MARSSEGKQDRSGKDDFRKPGNGSGIQGQKKRQKHSAAPDGAGYRIEQKQLVTETIEIHKCRKPEQHMEAGPEVFGLAVGNAHQNYSHGSHDENFPQNHICGPVTCGNI